jgi:hypothetical protein
MNKFWVFRNHGIQGPFTVTELFKLEGFSLSATVSKEGEGEWRPAKEFSVIANFDPTVEVVETGDYTYGPRKITDWREAVVPVEVEARPLFTSMIPSHIRAMDAAIPVPETPATPTTTATVISTATTVIEQTLSKASKPITRRARSKRESLLLVALSAVFLGVYTPQTDQVNAMVDTWLDSRLTQPMLWKPKPIGQRRVRLPWLRPNAMAQKAGAAAVNQPTVVDEMETPLLDGTVMKTVTTVVTKDGIRTTQTRSYVIQKATHSKPQKRRRAKATASN